MSLTMFLTSLVALLAVLTIIDEASSSSILLSSSTSLTSGVAICPNTPRVEFTCVAVEVSFLDWQVNGENIEPTFNIGDNPMTVSSGPYVLTLDTISADLMRPVANMTVRLAANNISSLPSGYRITCLELVAESSITLHYVLRGNPPALTDYTITTTEVNTTYIIFNFTSDPKFNSDYGISSYKLVPSPVQGHTMAECSSPFCPPTESCQCTGRSTGGCVYIAVSAVNCGNQEGPVKLITVATSCFYSELQLLDSLDIDCQYTMLRDSGSIPIQNGFVQYVGTSIGSLATYRCNEGYSLIGNSQRTCQSNGHWNGSTPECRHIQNNPSNPITATETVVGVVIFIVGVALGIVLTFLVLCAYKCLHYKGSLCLVNVPKQSPPLTVEYQDVQLKSANTGTIAITQNSAYGHGRRATIDTRNQHDVVEEIDLDENIAYI